MLFSKIIKKKFDAVLGRYEGDPALYYYSPSDFPGLQTEPADIPGDGGVMLKGCFYYYGDFCGEKLVVFDHGISAGHLAYLKEIEYLAKSGYTVYSYDHTGCVSTGGTGIHGFAQGVNDLDHVLTALHEDSRLKSSPVRLVGHSWGAYSAMNAAPFHPEVSHIVSFGGFLSARALVEQYIPKMFLRYSDEVMDRERVWNPKYTDLDARDSLMKTDAKFMHIQSHDDEKVTFERSMTLLEEALKTRPDTVFITMDHRNHEPYLTDAAVAARSAVLKEAEQLHKQKKLETKAEQDAFRKAHDWDAMSEEDPEIWKKVLDFLEK